MKRFLGQNWFWILGFVGIFLLAASIRIYHLTLLPVFVDEAIYIRWSQIMSNEATLRFLPLSDGKEPLFMWVLMFVVKRVSDPLFAGRVLSIASGIGTMVGVSILSFLLSKSKKVALIAALIYALNPFVFFFDRLALVDSMLSMFGVWTFIFAYLAIRDQRLDFAMLAGFALGGAWLTKSPALFFALMLPALWLFANWKGNSKNNFGVFLKSLSLSLVSIVIAFAMYNILRLGPNFNLIASRNQDYIYPLNHVFVSPLDPFMGHLGGIENYFYLMGPISLVFLIVFGIVNDVKRNARKILPVLAWAVLPIIVTMEYFKVVTARYILYTFPFFIILAAYAFTAKSKLLQKVLYFGLIAFIIQSLFFDYKLVTNVGAAPLPQGERSGFLEEWTAGQGIMETADFIKSQAKTLKPGQKIIVGTEGYFGTLPDGLEMYVQNVPNVIVIGVGLGINKVPDSLTSAKKSGDKTYLVINKSRLTGDPTKMGLRLIASYPKIPRELGSLGYNTNGSQEFLYLFEY